MGNKWTQDEEMALVNLVTRGATFDEVSMTLCRSKGAIEIHCHLKGLPLPRRSERAAVDPRREDNRVLNYKLKALSGLRHCKDLAAHHPYGCGELNIPADGVPKNFSFHANHFSVITSASALCMEG
jgi:hypothetical protein